MSWLSEIGPDGWRLVGLMETRHVRERIEGAVVANAYYGTSSQRCGSQTQLNQQSPRAVLYPGTTDLRGSSSPGTLANWSKPTGPGSQLSPVDDTESAEGVSRRTAVSSKPPTNFLSQTFDPITHPIVPTLPSEDMQNSDLLLCSSVDFASRQFQT